VQKKNVPMSIPLSSQLNPSLLKDIDCFISFLPKEVGKKCKKLWCYLSFHDMLICLFQHWLWLSYERKDLFFGKEYFLYKRKISITHSNEKTCSGQLLSISSFSYPLVVKMEEGTFPIIFIKVENFVVPGIREASFRFKPLSCPSTVSLDQWKEFLEKHLYVDDLLHISSCKEATVILSVILPKCLEFLIFSYLFSPFSTFLTTISKN
jgi:hypothetical protein